MTKRFNRVGAISGILFVVLQLLGQSLIQVGGSEPAFDADSQAIAEFFESRSSTLFSIGAFLSALSLASLLGFLPILGRMLKSVEGEQGWLSSVATTSGVAVVALLLGGGGAWTVAVFRVGEGLNPQVAMLLFDLGNYTFATSWVLFGILSLAVSVTTLWFNAFPKWLGTLRLLASSC